MLNVCQENLPLTIAHQQQPQPLIQGRIWICAFMVFTTSSDPAVLELESVLLDEAMFFQAIAQFWWACVNCFPSFLLLADNSGTQCGLLLLQLILFMVPSVVNDGILHSMSLTIGCFSCFSIITHQHFCPHNCRSVGHYFFQPFSVKTRDGCVWNSNWKSKSIGQL